MNGNGDEERVSLLGNSLIDANLRSRFRGSIKHRSLDDVDDGGRLVDFEPATTYDERFLKKYVADRSPDKIVAVFVVAFDTKAGNVMEWCIPDDIDTEGVEFKALTSGSHNMTTDFVYFRKGKLFGLSCFERIVVESHEERGSRMKSVGILSTSHTHLHGHMTFLQEQVSHLLSNPSDYGRLIDFWNSNRGLLVDPADVGLLLLPPGERERERGRRAVTSTFKASHPFHTFSHFFKYYGPEVFVLWKLALLGKRILFYSPPPIGVVCYRVYCTSELVRHSRQDRLPASPRSQAYFYVNVADIDDIQSENSYVACTTEKIFESKPHLYDVYVDGLNITSALTALKDIVKVNDVDRERYKNLLNYKLNRAFVDDEDEEEEAEDEDEIFMNFFREQNDRVLGTLLEASCSSDRQLTKDHMVHMNLHPHHDRSFVVELVEVFAIDVVPAVENPCCPT